MKPQRFDWKITGPDPGAVSEISSELNIASPIAKAMVNRGISTKFLADHYLNPSPADIHDPFLLEDMDKAVERTSKAIDNKERILVLGDYDVDGISGAALLVTFLRHIGANVNYYIPDREKEGYGLNVDVVRKCKSAGYGLIITVDSGVSSIKEAQLATELGLDLIIIDHHEPHAMLPEVVALVNPKRPDSAYPFRELAGVGVAFKFVMALGGTKGILTEELLDRYAELVALGTIGDLVGLQDENRVFVSYGLSRMNNPGNLGVHSLIEVSRYREDDRLDTFLVSFGLAPRINAAGRVWNPRAGVELLLTNSPERAAQLAKKLDEYNRARITEESQIFKDAEKLLKETAVTESDRAIVLFNENWNVGIIGIVASRLIERYYMPVILSTLSHKPEDRDTPHPEKGRVCQGSVRSITEVDIYEVLCQCEDILLSYGGHPMAAGIKIYENDIPVLRERLKALISTRMENRRARPAISIDDSLEFSEIDMNLLKQSHVMEPCGVGNPRPVFIARNVTVLDLQPCGAEGKHLRMRLGQNNVSLDAIGFGFGSHWSVQSFNGTNIDIVFTIKEDNFRNRRSIKLHLTDLRATE